MEVSSLHKKLSGVARAENRASESNGEDDQCCGEEIVLQVGSGIKGSPAQEDDFIDEGILNRMSSINHKVAAITKTERSSHESESRTSYISSAKFVEQVDDQLESAKAEMKEIMEENQRLKLYLDRVMKDYRTLQMQYRDAIQQEVSRTGEDSGDHGEGTHELIDLSLGMSSRDRTKKDARKTTSVSENTSEGGDKEGLTLALDCKFEVPRKLSPDQSPENSTGEVKGEIKETWQTKGSLKSARDGEDADEISQQNPTKRARVSVRVRCDTPTMNDGCQWRKYGQKIAKGNPCPRAYYRCTVAPSCPVRKQVQRCADDMSILITTYEGTHNHPLSVSATAMASTTSAAASMLLSGSSTSGTGPSLSSSTTSATNLNGLNLYLSNNSRSKPFYLPNTSISTSPAYPTITLDLTSTSTSSSASALTGLGNFAPRHSSTNLNFSTLDHPNPHPMSWSNGMLSYGHHQTHNKNQPPSSLTFGSQSNETLYQSYLHKVIPNPTQQSLPQDTIAAATKAITSDPNFQSALAVALSSIIGSGGSSTAALSNHNVGERSSQVSPSKASDSFPILSSFPSMFSSPNKKFL